MSEMKFEDWIQIGMDQGWAGPPVCSTHDGIPMTDEEFDEFHESDPCISVIRLYESNEHRLAVEAAHSPSVWRK